MRSAHIIFPRSDTSNLARSEFFIVRRCLDFSSDRRRMSILVQRWAAGNASCDDEVWLFCKGADDPVLGLCANLDGARHLSRAADAYANQGLRTLVFARRKVLILFRLAD